MFLWQQFRRKELAWTWAREAHWRRFISACNQCLIRNYADSSLHKSTKDEDKQRKEKRVKVLDSLVSRRIVRQKSSPVPLVEKVRANMQRVRERSEKRVLTPQELAEEERFAKFISSRTKVKDDNFGTMEQRDAEDKKHYRYSYNANKENLSHEFSAPVIKRNSSLPNDWTESFGTLSSIDEKSPVDKMLDPGLKYKREIQQDDKLYRIYNHVPLGNRDRPHPPDWYARRIQRLGDTGHIAEALVVFEKWMIERDRVKPTDYEYNIMISVLGKAGYSEKAIKLHNEMVRKGFKVIPKTYTSLFNAIANSPVPKEEGKRAHWLRNRMIKNGVIPEYITYQAMIKAFGMCGDLKTAFEVADEVIHFHGADDNLLTSLLVACISDKDAGFKHAIAVWKKCQKLGVKPEIRGYKLLLKAAQECDVGKQKLLKRMLFDETTKAKADRYRAEPALPHTFVPSEAEKSVVKEVEVPRDAPEKQTVTGETSVALRYEDNYVQVKSIVPDLSEAKKKERNKVSCTEIKETSGTHNIGAEHQSDNPNQERTLDKVKLSPGYDAKDNQQITCADSTSVLPSILDPNQDFSKIVHLGKVETCQDRFALIGGLSWFLKSFKENRIKPDKEIFKYLIGLTSEEDDKVLDEMIRFNVKPDISFCNKYLTMLVRSGRNFQHVLEMMKEMNIEPDIKTYTALAPGCKNIAMARDFLKAVEKGGFMPNIYVFLTLMSAAKMQFPYKAFILKKMQELDIRPDREFLIVMEKGISAAHGIVKDMDEGRRDKSDEFPKAFDTFLTFYEKWLKEIDVECEEGPWKTFHHPRDKK